MCEPQFDNQPIHLLRACTDSLVISNPGSLVYFANFLRYRLNSYVLDESPDHASPPLASRRRDCSQMLMGSIHCWLTGGRFDCRLKESVHCCLTGGRFDWCRLMGEKIDS